MIVRVRFFAGLLVLAGCEMSPPPATPAQPPSSTGGANAASVRSTSAASGVGAPAAADVGCVNRDTVVRVMPRGGPSTRWTSVLFDEPAPPNGDQAAEVPALESALAGDAAYQALWTAPRADLNAFLSYVSVMIATNVPMSRRDIEPVTSLVNQLRPRKLDDAATKVFGIHSRTGVLPESFAKGLCAHLEATRNEPHLGAWAPYDPGGVVHDYTALAAWLRPVDPRYLREHVAAKRDGRTKDAGPFTWGSWTGGHRWMLSKEDAIARLGRLTALTKEEQKVLDDQKTWDNTP